MLIQNLNFSATFGIKLKIFNLLRLKLMLVLKYLGAFEFFLFKSEVEKICAKTKIK